MIYIYLHFLIHLKLNFKIYALNDVLFSETSPGPVKYALSKMTKCKNILRSPLVEIEAQNMRKIDKVLKKLKLI